MGNFARLVTPICSHPLPSPQCLVAIRTPFKTFNSIQFVTFHVSKTIKLNKGSFLSSVWRPPCNWQNQTKSVRQSVKSNQSRRMTLLNAVQFNFASGNRSLSLGHVPPAQRQYWLEVIRFFDGSSWLCIFFACKSIIPQWACIPFGSSWAREMAQSAAHWLLSLSIYSSVSRSIAIFSRWPMLGAHLAATSAPPLDRWIYVCYLLRLSFTLLCTLSGDHPTNWANT